MNEENIALKVETFTPPNTHKPIGPYSHVAKVGQFITILREAGVDIRTNTVRQTMEINVL